MYHIPAGAAFDEGCLEVPSWVFPGASLDIDFAGGRAWPGGQIAPLVTVSRASSKFVDNSGGLWLPVATGQLALSDKGALIEEARTNDALWCRDCTNAAWTKLNMTAALTATGIDGVANSASTLTATAGNASVLQTITLGSSADTYSVWLKRVSGSGTVNIAIDGVTWTAAAITTTWTRFQVTSTLVNPVFGIQIVTSGDVVAADFNQLEPGSFATSPIATTTVAATRAADVVTVTSPPSFGIAYTLFAKGTPNAPASYTSTQIPLAINDGTTNNRFEIRRRSADGTEGALIASGGSVSYNAGNSVVETSGVSHKAAFAGAANDQSYVYDGGVVTSPNVAAMPVSPTTISIGSGSGVSWNGYGERIALFPSRLSNAALQAITT